MDFTRFCYAVILIAIFLPRAIGSDFVCREL